MTITADRVWTNARLATMAENADGLGIVENGMVAAKDSAIVYAGPVVDVDAPEIIDCEGRWITPGLVDCHTHLIHGGNRAHEFELRLAGASYEEIARAGGGIVSTMKATREASEADLIASALPRLDAMIAEGLTTIEIKSGYGLSAADELKMLRAAGAVESERDVHVSVTFLGAHAVPPEHDADSYIDEVVAMIPAIVPYVDAVDGFCERIGFSPEQIDRVFTAARAMDLPVKLHAEQLSNLHGAALAARHGALSADHLEYLDEAGIAAMKAAGTVAVLLPGAYYFTRETKLPPLDGLRAAGVPIALATDCNPGTSPMTSILLVMNMAATLFRMTVEECLAGVTREGARALGMLDRIGTLEPGKSCDLAIWDIERPAELVYRIGFNPLWRRVWRGQEATQ